MNAALALRQPWRDNDLDLIVRATRKRPRRPAVCALVPGMTRIPVLVLREEALLRWADHGLADDLIRGTVTDEKPGHNQRVSRQPRTNSTTLFYAPTTSA